MNHRFPFSDRPRAGGDAEGVRGLAERVATNIGASFRTVAPPTIIADFGAASQVALSYVKYAGGKKGLSTPSPLEDAFVMNVPMTEAQFPAVIVEGRRQSVSQVPGHSYLFDLKSPTKVSLETAYETVRFHVPQPFIDNVAYEKGLNAVGGLHAKSLGQEDRTLYQFALAMLPAITSPSHVSSAFVEYMVLALHEHLVFTYADARRKTTLVGGLAPWQIQRAREFVDANLSRDITIAELGRECGISASHFARAFRASLGVTPHHWITNRRLDRARSLMLKTGESLAEIAVACGFVDQSHLGRQFLRETGVSPAQWRRTHRI